MRKLLSLILKAVLLFPCLPVGAQTSGIVLPPTSGNISSTALYQGDLLFTTTESGHL